MPSMHKASLSALLAGSKRRKLDPDEEAKARCARCRLSYLGATPRHRARTSAGPHARTRSPSPRRPLQRQIARPVALFRLNAFALATTVSSATLAVLQPAKRSSHRISSHPRARMEPTQLSQLTTRINKVLVQPSATPFNFPMKGALEGYIGRLRTTRTLEEECIENVRLLARMSEVLREGCAGYAGWIGPLRPRPVLLTMQTPYPLPAQKYVISASWWRYQLAAHPQGARAPRAGPVRHPRAQGAPQGDARGVRRGRRGGGDAGGRVH